MIRTMLAPKWLGALMLAVVFALICGLLGNWQLREARAEARAQEIERAAALPISPLTEVVEPQSAFPPDGSTRRITTSGEYRAADQVLIADRRLGEQHGYWVVTPLIVTETGAALPVLRGFITDPGAAPAPPQGVVDIGGGLAPGESPTSQAGLGDGILRSIDMGLLVNRWDTSVYNLFVFLTEESVAGDPVPATGLERVPPPTGEASEMNLKNAMYALQWWMFAAFGFFLWWRAVRQEHLEITGRARDQDADPDEAARETDSGEPHSYAADSTGEPPMGEDRGAGEPGGEPAPEHDDQAHDQPQGQLT